MLVIFSLLYLNFIIITQIPSCFTLSIEMKSSLNTYRIIVGPHFLNLENLARHKSLCMHWIRVALSFELALHLHSRVYWIKFFCELKLSTMPLVPLNFLHLVGKLLSWSNPPLQLLSLFPVHFQRLNHLLH